MNLENRKQKKAARENKKELYKRGQQGMGVKNDIGEEIRSKARKKNKKIKKREDVKNKNKKN